MEQNCINLNIYIDHPPEIWKKIPKIYEQLPGWLGFGMGENQGELGIPYWYGYDNASETISASCESSGLQICAKMERMEKSVQENRNCGARI